MRLGTRLLSAVLAAATAFICASAPVYASDGKTSEPPHYRYYDKISGYESSIKTFIKKYQKDEQAGIEFFHKELTYDDGAAHIFVPEKIAKLFRECADCGVAVHYEKGDEFDEKSIYRQFGINFFCADGSYFDTPMYDVETTKALSMKQIIKDSGIPDCGDIAAAEVWYYTWGLSSVKLELSMLHGGWLQAMTQDAYSCPNGFFLATEHANNFASHAYYFNEDGSIQNKTTFIDGKRMLFDSDGTCKGSYTGWTKTKSGKRRYYDRGKMLSDWQLVNGKYYHFGSNGYADTGKVKIAGCTYTFDKNGVWTGKRSKAGARPSDFTAGFSQYSFKYNSKDAKMTRTVDYDSSIEGDDKNVYAYGSYKLSAKDSQIIWSLLNEYDLLSADPNTAYVDDLNEDYVLRLGKKYGIDELWGVEPNTVYTVSFTANGKEYEFKFDYESKQFVGIDKTITGLWAAFGYLFDRVSASDAYKSLPPSELLLD